MFNGHRNWNHWNVSLWIKNDESLYRLALECIDDTSNRHAAAAAMMAQLRRDAAVNNEGDAPTTPDGAPYSVTTIRAAMVDM